MNHDATLPQTFDPGSIESELYEEWERKGYFIPTGEGQSFSIAIPPPNVTGILHLGHAFQQTLMDALIRYRRMLGNNTLWQTGTDHAGIATQMVVTEQIRAEGITPTELGREAFIDRVWQWRRESGGTITQQMRRMGASLDWSRERFTMDEGFSQAVIEVFVRLYEDGLIYKGERLVNWDPDLKTALSDLEIDTEEEDGHLWHLRYPLADGEKTPKGDDYLVVATTRPETMLGDTAVAVHPKDERYRSLIGKFVTLPLANRRLPIVADEHVDPEFGTGCLKITPAHDFADYDIGTRHGLEFINVMTTDATINENAPEEFRGLDRFDARKKVVESLQTQGLLDGIEPYRVQIPRGERSNVIVEPLLTYQWFVNIKPLAEPAIEAVENGSIVFEPKRWANVYFGWMRNVQDWCISRQQWWGHQIPAWYDEEQNIFVGRTEQEAREKANLADDVKLTRDPDVLDTWFSSALWTFATLGWPNQSKDLKVHHPTDVLVTGHDIIFFWVARMIMMTLRFTGDVPFRTVYITGLIRDAEGKKMSKTAGNGLDPLDIVDGIALESLIQKRTTNLPQPRLAPHIEKATRNDFPHGIQPFGADALRLTFCAIASPGSTYNFSMNRVEGNHFFCNKLWQATKFVLTNVSDIPQHDSSALSIPDRWILSRMKQLIRDVRFAVDTYRFDLYASHVYDFVWHEYCDWYLELTKPVLTDKEGSNDSKNAARATLIGVLEMILRIAHPIMPFITEKLWREIRPLTRREKPSIMLESFPSEEQILKDEESEKTIDWLKAVVAAIRNIRGERQIPPKSPVTVLMSDGSDQDRQYKTETNALLAKLANISEIRWVSDDESNLPGSVQLVGELKITVPFVNEQEVGAERARIEKKLSQVTKELSQVQNKLNNKNFVERAPQEVVEKQRIRADFLVAARETLETESANLPDL